ncbi:MAG TPA: ligase-associated DNA damage response exonuclease, partial [Candidatus Melainabacteria bacterium]|nr:ligase-associated DNA damage response exonuclease [Candidatus Melainabacteria bacterium]
MELLKLSDSGLYCEVGDFFIDPWRPVDRALITHAHSDHARPGSRSYLCQAASLPVMKLRLGEDTCIETTKYGEITTMNGVSVSFHPAGHIMGSAQIRVEYRGEVFVVSGDYKTDPDPTCLPFEPVACHTFISESTFGLPVYQWPDSKSVFSEINRWWCANRDQGKTSILFVYSLGKAQRVLLGIDSSIGTIHTHGAVENINEIYREAGVALPVTHRVSGEKKEDWRGTLILAPPSAQQSAWIKKFGSVSTGFASGWMR